MATESLCVHSEMTFTRGRNNFSLVAVKTAHTDPLDSRVHNRCHQFTRVPYEL